jgi:putative CRISPR-associated protein (TIGR02619 family)
MKIVINPVGVSLLENVSIRRIQLPGFGLPSAQDVRNLENRCKKLEPSEAAALTTPLTQSIALGFVHALSRLWASDERKYTISGGRRKREYSPAELASLSLLDLQPGDGVLLLYSETTGGAFCAAVLEQLLSKGVAVPAGLQVEKQMVRGLQLEDFGRFTDEGIVNYARAVDLIVHAHPEANSVLLNITGGFKGVAPIATIVAMALDVEVCYLYEESDQLLFLPPLNVRFGYSRLFNRHENVMQHITPPPRTIPEGKFWQPALEEDREQLQKYVQSTDGALRLSPLGVLAWELHTLHPEIGQARPRGPLEAA